MVEVLIALGISGILILGLTRLLAISQWTYSRQEQLTDLTQNTRFTIKEIGDALQQAGSNCSVARDTIVKPPGAVCSACSVKVNPQGGYFAVTSVIKPAQYYLVVSNVAAFDTIYSKQLFKAPADTTVTPKIYTIDSINTTTSRVWFHPSDTFSINDVVYPFVNNRYYLSGSSFCLNADTVAENIDSLNITFLDANGAATAIWKNMKSVQLVVIGKTSLPDPLYKGYSDHRRRLRLSYNFRFKNKL